MLRFICLAKVATASEDVLLNEDVSLLQMRVRTENKLDPGAPGWDASPYKGQTGWENLGKPYTWKKDIAPSIYAWSDLDADWPLGWHEGIIPERWKSGWKSGFSGWSGLPSNNRDTGFTRTKEECAQQCGGYNSPVAAAQWAPPELEEFFNSGRWKTSPYGAQLEKEGQGWRDWFLNQYRQRGKGKCLCSLCWKPTESYQPGAKTKIPGMLTLGPEDLFSPYAHGKPPLYEGIRLQATHSCKYEPDFDPVCGYSKIDDEGGCIQEEADEASAQGDPHITTNSGTHFDMELPAEP